MLRELATPINFTLKDQEGNTHTLDDYIGKTIVLHFYAIDCFSCLDELPHIEKIYNDYNQNKDDVIILGIANTSRNPKDDIIDLFGKVIEQNSQNMISLIQEYKSGDDNDVYINSTYRNNSRYAYNYNF